MNRAVLIEDLSRDHDAGTLNNATQAAAQFKRARNGALHVGLARHVGWKEANLLAEFHSELLARFTVDVGDEYVSTGRRQQFHRRAAQTRGAAREQKRVALNVHDRTLRCYRSFKWTFTEPQEALLHGAGRRPRHR